MNLREFVEGVNLFLENNPEMSENLVVCSSDDEGSNFQEVTRTPICMVTECPEEYFMTVYPEEHLEEVDERVEVWHKVVCIN